MKNLKFKIGEKILISHSGNRVTYQVKEGPEGEPYKHKVFKSGKVSKTGSRIRSDRKFTRVTE